MNAVLDSCCISRHSDSLLVYCCLPCGLPRLIQLTLMGHWCHFLNYHMVVSHAYLHMHICTQLEALMFRCCVCTFYTYAQAMIGWLLNDQCQSVRDCACRHVCAHHVKKSLRTSFVLLIRCPRTDIHRLTLCQNVLFTYIEVSIGLCNIMPQLIRSENR